MTAREHLDSAAAYALGAVDPADAAALDGLLASDPEFRREVERYREVVGLMAWAAPTVAAPAALRQRIVTGAQGVRPIASAPSAKPARRLVGVLPWLAAAACLGIAVMNTGRLREAREANGALLGELATAQSEIATRDSTLSAFLGPEVHVVSLSEGAAKPTARVFWNHTKQVFIVTAFNVPRAPDDKTYQLWAIAKGRNPMSMGTFNTDASGRATLVVPVSATVIEGGHIDLCGLTLEPRGGSMQPTEQPRLVGSWRHTD